MMPAPTSLKVVPLTIPQQRIFEGRPFPLVLKPSEEALDAQSNGMQIAHANGETAASSDKSSNAVFEKLQLADVEAWIKENNGWLDGQLKQHGAVLLRGFPIKTPSDFNAVVEAFGWEEFPYVGGAAPRTNVVGRVFTSNESPPDQKIPFHHEMAQVPEFPARLFFFCEIEPGEQGETPLLLSNVLAQRMEEKRPEFVKNLREQGLIYTRILPDLDDPTSAIGRGWRSTFLTTDKEEAARRGAKLGVHLEWQPDGCVKTVTSVLPALRKDSVTGRVAWFNSMVAAYTGWKDSRNVPDRAVTFGDGTPLPGDAVLETLKVMEEISVVVPWVQGDVLLIDNNTVQHARRTFVPPRRVLAALTK